MRWDVKEDDGLTAGVISVNAQAMGVSRQSNQKALS